MALEDAHASQLTPREPAQLLHRIILRSNDDSVLLKQLIPDDAEGYFQLVNADRTHLSQHGDTTAEKYPTVEAVRNSIVHPKNSDKYRFGIWDGETMVGSVNLTQLEGNRAESGSWVGKDHMGHNYAARARRLLVDFGFNQLGVGEIISKIVVGNLPSRRSVEKSGYTYAGDIEEDGKKQWLFVLKNPRPKEQSTIHRAETILSNLCLTWDDLKDKSVLDMASGPSALAHTASMLGIHTKIFSIDIDRQKEWVGLPQDVKSKIVQGDAEKLPFADESFDVVLDHGGMGILGIQEAARTLRLGGQFRMYPIGSQALEYWNISYYLTEEKGLDPESVQRLIQGFDQQITEADGWIPNEYIRLREEALNALSPGQKIDVIEMMVDRYAQITEMPPFSYELKDPMAHEPNGVMIYNKSY